MENLSINGRPLHIVAGLHGNERSPVRALEDTNIAFTLGNPEAYKINRRFIDRDLNASFAIDDTSSYEAKRAAELLKLISPSELVLDFHTTSSETEPFVVLTDIEMLPHAEYSGLKKAVLMTHNIKSGHALINHRDGFSIEMSGYDGQESYSITKSVISNIESGSKSNLELYEVFGRITDSGDYKNFTYHEAGFFPVLVGEEAYDFIGLKARKLRD